MCYTPVPQPDSFPYYYTEIHSRRSSMGMDSPATSTELDGDEALLE